MSLISSKYKVSLKVNKNIWKNNEKILSFNKKKWSRLQSNIKRDSFFNSQVPWYQVQNQKLKNDYLNNNISPLFAKETNYYLKKSNLRFFKNNFMNNIEYKLSHGNITNKQLKVVLNKVKNKKGSLLFNDLKESTLLQKLDYSLWTLNLVKSLFEIKQLVSHKHIYVNGKSMNINMYNLGKSDTVSLKYSNLTLGNMNLYLTKVNNYLYYKYLLTLPKLPNLSLFNNLYWINMLKSNIKMNNKNQFDLFQDPRQN